MPLAQYEHQCTHCDKNYQMSQSWINPELYTDKSKAFMTITFWCKKCHQGQALKLEMLPDVQVAIREVIDYKSLIKDSAIDYFMPDNDLPEIDDEDDPVRKINSITEEQVMEILSALK